jgi:hypothetical protein
MVSGNYSPKEAQELEEDLGIELDSPEHVALEKGPLGNAVRKSAVKHGN